MGTDRSLWATARLVAAKDLRIEARSRVLTNQVLPFALVVLVLFGFAFDAARTDADVLRAATPGLFWVTVIFSSVLAAQRSTAVEMADGGADGLRLSGLEPAGIFVGKAAALAVQLLALEMAMGIGVLVLFPVQLRASGALPMLVACVATTIGLACASTIYGALTAGQRVRDTLLPLLLLPVVAPLLISATRAVEYALGTAVEERKVSTVDPADAWPWIGLMVVFALVYVAAGLLAYGPLQEDA